VFTTLVLMTGITAAIPYAFSALAQILWRMRDGAQAHQGRLVFDLAVAVVALAMSLGFIYWSRNTGADWYVVWGPFLMAGGAMALGVPVFAAQRGRMTAPPAVPAQPR
jgi:APA family basic amino acid/polyamine antiporter